MYLQSARRELDRQRQMEWERQRKEQLMAEKAREYEQLMALKSQTSNFTCELESLVRALLYVAFLSFFQKAAVVNVNDVNFY